MCSLSTHAECITPVARALCTTPDPDIGAVHYRESIAFARCHYGNIVGSRQNVILSVDPLSGYAAISATELLIQKSRRGLGRAATERRSFIWHPVYTLRITSFYACEAGRPMYTVFCTLKTPIVVKIPDWRGGRLIAL